MNNESHLLEINLISAQGLKPPSGTLRRMQTYALAWADPAAKLRTRVDRIGGENPTWNEKFVFRISSDFLSSETSAVVVEIYAVGYIKDPLVGTVRFLLSSCISASSGAGFGTPAFTAVQIRRPSGRFHGVLNIAATLVDGLGLPALSDATAICFRDLIGESRRQRRQRKAERSSGGDSCGDSADFSDGGDSTTSSSSTASTALKEWNNAVRNEMAGKNGLRSDGGGMLCGLMLQRKIHLGPLDQSYGGASSREKEN